ncbi:hypothetical protein LIER_17578 [Lithospermum erythrorhizon]|uniref:F-box protein n=1 Tax=Lithospermum erythrorhizon TaxID=34254 RepID=A0AAV3QC66_LITER
MAKIQAASFIYTSDCKSFPYRNISAAISIPRLIKGSQISIPLQLRTTFEDETIIVPNLPQNKKSKADDFTGPDPLVIAKLYEILEGISDRVEMHKNVGEQRNNWNSLLLTSINSITLAAATMAAMAAATNIVGDAALALKISSTTLYLGATGMLSIMNKIQPSQLAEEQRNAARLFKNLGTQIEKLIAIGNPTAQDVKIMMEKVLALDKAYLLPLLGKMLEKYPSKVEPAIWWPEARRRQRKETTDLSNGWNFKLEGTMGEIIKVMKKNDKEDYLRLGEKALKIHKALAVSGPFLTGLAALGTTFVGHGSLPVMVGVFGGALATIVNTFEHAAQVGMVLELYRSNAGFFKFMEESIESNLLEKDVNRRENGELFELKVALQLGRSLSELRDLANISARDDGDIEEFASKLF